MQRGLFASREKAAYAIRAGAVRAAGKVVRKPGTLVDPDVPVSVDEARGLLHIGRGERKLAGILERFRIACEGRVALDVGAGAGGFTWQLLQHGVARVYTVDVGHDQLHPELRADPRVVVMEDTDIRALTALPELPTLAVVDVSFISLRLVLPAVQRLVAADADVVALVKPQFEAGRLEFRGAYVVRDRHLRYQVFYDFASWCAAQGWSILAALPSLLPGKQGNREAFAHLAFAQRDAALSPAAFAEGARGARKIAAETWGA